jgi:polyhydroxybutyrate depolymerase
MDFWTNFNNCNNTPIITNVPDINTNDGCTAEHQIWENGTNGATVEHYKIIDGEHSWPGALFSNGTTNQDINAAEKIWEFFNKYDINGVISTRTSLEENIKDKRISKITDILGRETNYISNTPLFYIYDDGTKEKIIIIE